MNTEDRRLRLLTWSIIILGVVTFAVGILLDNGVVQLIGMVLLVGVVVPGWVLTLSARKARSR